jgi:hypothetical protein
MDAARTWAAQRLHRFRVASVPRALPAIAEVAAQVITPTRAKGRNALSPERKGLFFG